MPVPSHTRGFSNPARSIVRGLLVMILNMSADTDPQLQEEALPQRLPAGCLQTSSAKELSMQFAISILPADPQFVPPEASVKSAVLVVEKYFPYPRDFEVEVETFPEPHFFRAGESCDRFVCPECATKVRSDEDDDWYGRFDAAEAAPNALAYRMEMPCCKKQVLLSDISFDSHWGLTAFIARFRISRDDINPDDVPEAFLQEMQQALGCDAVQMMGAGT